VYVQCDSLQGGPTYNRETLQVGPNEGPTPIAEVCCRERVEAELPMCFSAIPPGGGSAAHPALDVGVGATSARVQRAPTLSAGRLSGSTLATELSKGHGKTLLPDREPNHRAFQLLRRPQADGDVMQRLCGTGQKFGSW